MQRTGEHVGVRSPSVAEAANPLRLPAKVLRAHVRRGLPNTDGCIDLVVYAAWVNRQEQERKGETDGVA